MSAPQEERGLDPVSLQVLVGALRAACDEMGAVLIRSAYSANIKERHDCSTALFDPAGELVMQAEHIPVHLGSMPDAVAAVLDQEHRPGDVWILNDPYRGGTHLPDITLISPIFAPHETGSRRPLGFAASRAHHADIGGPTPGGMPADSTRLQDEGVVIPPTRATDDVLEGLAHQMRNPPSASPTCARSGPRTSPASGGCWSSSSGQGPTVLRTGMAEILDYAERRTRAKLSELPDGTYEAEDVLEDDAAGPERDIHLRVSARIEADRLTLDFTGTDPQVEGNLNCPLSVTKSAAFFCGARRDRSRRAAVRRRLPADRGDRPGGLPAEREVPGCGRRRQRRDVEPGGGPGAVGARRRDRRSGPGPGDDEQPDLRRRDLHVLRDARGRTGGVPERRRPRRDPRRDVQHAEHADRGARDRVPGARAGAQRSPRQRRRGRASRRRRARPRAGGARAARLHADHRAPRPRAPRPRGRGRRRARRETS